MSDRLPRLKDNDGVTNPQTGKALLGFARFWDAAMRGIEARLQAITDGIVVAINGQAVTREIEGGTGIVVTNGSGVAGNPVITSNFDGFGFSSSNLFADNEFLGHGIFPVPITFPSATVNPSIKSQVPAAANASLSIVPVVGGVDQAAVGTIDFLAGSTSASVSWTPNPYTLPANTPLKLYAPSSRDTSLSFLTAFIPGDI